VSWNRGQFRAVLVLIETVAGGSDGTRFKQRTGGKAGVQCWAFSKSKRKSVLVRTKELAPSWLFRLHSKIMRSRSLHRMPRKGPRKSMRLRPKYKSTTLRRKSETKGSAMNATRNASPQLTQVISGRLFALWGAWKNKDAAAHNAVAC